MLWIPEGFSGFTQDSELVGKWVTEKSGGRYTQGATGIGIIKDGKLAVGVMYDGFTGRNGSILMSSRCDDPKATSKWFYWAIFDYPFNQLGVKRCNVLVHENNERALKLNKKLGFVGDTVIKDYFPNGDAVLLAMYRSDCRWLKGSNNDKALDTGIST
jgi:hypothetical protein